jgi:hypothetical protein
MYMTVLAFFVAALSFVAILLGWRSMITEQKHFKWFRDFHTETGTLGVSGSVLLGLTALYLNHLGYHRYGWGDSTGIYIMMGVVAVISLFMCGGIWFSGTKVAYWIENHEWPSPEQWRLETAGDE